MIFGGPPPLVGRTRWTCARLGLEVDVVPELGAALAHAATTGGAWLLRAGAWPARSALRALAASATGRPVVAIGAVLGEPSDTTRDWTEVLRRTRGALEGVGWLPRVASAWVDAEGARQLAEAGRTLADGGGALHLEDAILRARDVRLVRVAELDVRFEERLRVLQVTTSLQQGGAERIVLGLVDGLRGAGLTCELALIGRPTRRSWPAPSGTHDLSATRGRPEQAGEIVELAARFGADLAHLHLLEGPLTEALARAGLPLAMTVHNARSGWPAGLEALELDAPPLVVACANAVLAELAATPLGRRARTSWNATDPEVWRGAGPSPSALGAPPSRAALGIPPEAIVLLAVANPRPQKRLHLLPLVARAVSVRTARPVHVVLAGAPSAVHADAAEAHAALVGAARRAEIPLHELGSVEPSRATYRLGDVLVSTSAWEGLSVAQLEALAAGVPVVATDVGGTREIPGVTCVPIDAPPERYAEAITASLASPERPHLPESFTLPALVARHVHLYRRTLAPRTGAGLWLVTNNFSTGGAQSSARRLLAALHAAGVRVRAAVIEEHAAHPTPGRSALEAAGVPVYVAPHLATNDARTTVGALLEALDRDPPAAVLFWNLVAEHKVLLADALLDARVIDVSPGEMFHTSLARYFARPRRDVPYARATDYGARLHALVVKHHGEVDEARAHLGAPVHVIPNGVALDRPPPRRDDHAGPLRLVTAARIAPAKRLEDLLDALHLAAPALAATPWTLDVVGAPERGAEAYAAELRARAGSLPVRWCGELADPRSALEAADLMLMISEPAGCPNASLEAMAAGLPVIATDVGGAREQVVPGETGWLVPARDVRAFAAALTTAVRDRAALRAMGARARSRVEHLFPLDLMVRRYRDLAGI